MKKKIMSRAFAALVAVMLAFGVGPTTVYGQCEDSYEVVRPTNILPGGPPGQD